MYFVYFYITGIMTYSQIGVILITDEDNVDLEQSGEENIYEMPAVSYLHSEQLRNTVWQETESC